MKHLLLTLAYLLLAAGSVRAAVIGTDVTYHDGTQQLKGYIAYDDAISGKRPGIVVVHEWWGQNEYVRKRARMLAELGYVALAVDMYGDGKQADHPDEASKFAGEVQKHMDVGRRRFAAGLKLLREHPMTDANRIAAIGYCFGGGIVLQMARDGMDLKGVVSFHGSLATNAPAEKGKVKAAILVCNGGGDIFTTMDQIKGFMAEMIGAGVLLRFNSYPGAWHAFTNPDADRLGAKFKLHLAYNAEADRQSWQDMQCFLKQIFAKGA
jgi:dienelactone hydrolase